MAMLPSDESDLEFFFRRSGQYQQSTFGPMLERAAIAGTDSDGKRIEAFRNTTFWRPGGEDQVIRPGGFTRNEPSYTPNVEEFHRFGQMSRRLNAVRAKSMLLRAALEAYYGDSGQRWREMAEPARNDDGDTVRPGYGPGQIVSLYALTKGGQELLKKALANKTIHRTLDEHLEAALLQVAAKPKGQTKALLDGIRLEADKLLLQARSAYLGACIAEDPSRAKRRPPRQGKPEAVRWPSRMEEAS